MPVNRRSAPGPAAGYHWQIQRSLIALLRAPSDCSVSLETLDDLVVANETGATTFEQLKHSIHPGTLSDTSRSLWRALDAWMDLLDDALLEPDDILLLVATDDAPSGSAAASLRWNSQQRERAEHLLLQAAGAPDGATSTADARRRFSSLTPPTRARLLEHVRVEDGTPDVGGFRVELRSALGIAMPLVGIESFLDRIVGWWERRAVDMLLRRRTRVSRDEVYEAIAGIRDDFTSRTLPAADSDIAEATEALTEALVTAYKGAPFVRQLELIAVRDVRLQVLVASYHRAYAQRSRWLEDGILAPDELAEWEDRLADEWGLAFARMCDSLPDEPGEDEQAKAGHALYDDLEQSGLNPLRDGRDRFLHVGTWHGLADTRRVGWHPDFQERLTALLGPPTVGPT